MWLYFLQSGFDKIQIAIRLDNMPKLKFNLKKTAPKILVIAVIFGLGLGAGYLYFNSQSPVENSEVRSETANVYVDFVLEVYDTIKTHYWQEMTEKQLAQVFKQQLDTISAGYVRDEVDSRESLKELAKKVVTDQADEGTKKEIVATWTDVVLAGLDPAGRSRLYTTKKREDLSNRVQNVNPEKDLYQDLGVGREATREDIESAYQEKKEELEPKAEQSEEAAKELEKVTYAHQVLADENKRKRYAETGSEPTVESRLLSPSVWYVKIKKQSPATLDEFAQAANSVNQTERLDSMILDLRGNVGGSLDILPYMLGPFIGKNQYAYDLFQQGDHEPYKTKTGWLSSLVPYKKVVILIDSQTQSSAEVMASALKKYNVGVVVGTPTKGWGTIEKVFDVETKIDAEENYGVFLVHHLTLRPDNNPIEGRGVDPMVNVENPDWQNQLLAYFNSPELVSEVATLVQ